MPDFLLRVIAAACVWLSIGTVATVAAGDDDIWAASTNGTTGLTAKLFASVQVGKFPAELEPYLSGKRAFAREDANWPSLTFLLGEAQLQRGLDEQARSSFRGLAVWAASDDPRGPYGDTWGGSGLAAISLWRWLQLLEANATDNSNEIGEAIAVAAALQKTRLYSGMMRGGWVLPALPLLQEDIARQLAYIAWTTRRPESTALFVDYLKIESTGELTQTDLEIQKEIIRQGVFTPERFELFRARRLIGLVRTSADKERAAGALKQLWADPGVDTEVRAEAGYAWANYKRLQKDRQELVTVLTDVMQLAKTGPIAERALFRRGTLHNRGWQEKVNAEFKADMLELAVRFPNGRLADDALFQLATEYLFEPDVATALEYFTKLRNLNGVNDYLDSAYFLPALGLIGRASEGDLESADQLLAEYIARYPAGAFRLRCLFWRGRIAERKDDTRQAQAFFRQVANDAPYDYYGLRARMHLEEGAAAATKDLPGGESQIRSTLRKTYRNSRVDTQLAGSTPYHQRLRDAVDSGLYAELLAVERRLDERLDNIPAGSLSDRSLVAAAALLLSLRQDALAARDAQLTPDNWLRLSGLLGHRAGDWPIAIEMTAMRGNTAQKRTTDLQRDPRYLGTVYPDPNNFAFLPSLSQAAWPIDGSQELSQSLMYAVMRHESRYYPRAISREGALGLFQIMPALFRSFDRNWNLLEESNLSSPVDYLLDPARSIRLWARWVRTEFSLKQRDGLALAIMKHQAGSRNVGHWNNYWKELGAYSDIEYQIETARFNATRNFVRLVVRDTIIVDAAGFFAGQAATGGTK